MPSSGADLAGRFFYESVNGAVAFCGMEAESGGELVPIVSLF
jgi:hypothetical protein